MVKCSAYKCNSASYNRTPGLSFHRFPKNNDLKKIWVQNMNHGHWQPTSSSVLCSNHFEEHLKDSSVFCTILRPGAIPTLFEEYSEKMAMSSADRCRKYREKLKQSNPEKFEEMKKKNAERTKAKKKKIADMNDDEQEEMRYKWRSWSSRKIIESREGESSAEDEESSHRRYHSQLAWVPSQTLAKRPRLPPRKQKRRSVDDDSEGSLTDPGEHQVEVKVERDDGNYILVSDPLPTQDSASGSFKELYSHSPRDLLHPYEQPSTSTIDPVIKEEIEDEDYKEMFLKLQEEVEALKSDNQRLMIENNNLAREIHNLKDTTQNVKARAVINDSVKNNDFLRKLAKDNQRLSEKIFEYAEKIRDLNSQYKHVDESIIIVDQNDSHEHEKLETLTDKLRRLTEENKKVISERDNLKDTVQNLLVDLENFSEDNKALKRMVKLQRKRVEKLRIQCGIHAGTIKRLMLSSVKLRCHMLHCTERTKRFTHSYPYYQCSVAR